MQKLVVYQNNKIVSECEYDFRLDQSKVKEFGVLEFELNNKNVFRFTLSNIKGFEYLSNKTVVFLKDVDEDIQLKLKDTILNDSLCDGEDYLVSLVYDYYDSTITCNALFIVTDTRFRLFVSKYYFIDGSISLTFTTIDNFVFNAIRNM